MQQICMKQTQDQVCRVWSGIILQAVWQEPLTEQLCGEAFKEPDYNTETSFKEKIKSVASVKGLCCVFMIKELCI